MTRPARAGAVVYAVDHERVAAFYEGLLAMRRVHDGADHVVLQSPDIQLTVHAIPAFISATITITSPPALREDTAIKLFFTVASLAQAVAPALGGEVFEETWEGEGFFQVREFTS